MGWGSEEIGIKQIVIDRLTDRLITTETKQKLPWYFHQGNEAAQIQGINLSSA